MWDVIAAERGALADDLAGLSDEQWQTVSLCPDWTVRRVVGHLTATARMTPASFVGSFAKAGFSFNRFANTAIDKNLGPGNVATLANFRAVQHATTSPPGPKLSWLGEVLVHAEDIRRPLGITHSYDLDSVVEVADFFKTSNALIGTKSRISGLSLKAVDADWLHGSGDEVSGPMLSLLMAMTGRAAACDDLYGPGVAKLRAGGH
ncbi:MAG: maleylpyruvate isomerase family mycothiol-dependent enzyme [Propionibacteriales bacterium]|nr:maleylpyruvate isomerase family mycothiol-dependent enzyme [Propionibacteriales bacterium]